ncbi:MAG: diacylglycerol kinase [Shewanella sp.]|uniref:diacylglycerol kinase n=1 Tax=Vibrio TaxID=662 RepID=UPI0023F953E8|nr:diacylglycerol kinase [Vibrio sp. VCS]
MQQEIIIKRVGMQRIMYTFVHSFNGFKWLCKNEAAFQQELMLFVPLTMFAFWLDLPAMHTLFVMLGMVFVLFAEMVNTAIEAVVDRVGLEYHALSGVAKNIGSAVVLLSMICSLTIWVVVVWTNYI